jgi:hypothetical protein
MERTQYLRAQAALLRGVAGTFDMQSIRDRLLALAQECEQLATLVKKEGVGAGTEEVTVARAYRPGRAPGGKPP